MRYVAAAYLLVVAAVSAMVGLGALSNLWSGYQDSPTSTYLLIGVPAVAFAIACAAAAVYKIHHR